MHTFPVWKYASVFLLTLALVGCYDHHDDSHRDTSTEVVCSSDSFCDPTSFTCTSTFDEIFTTFIDEYGHDFDRHTTITEDTVVTRIDDVDGTLQTETFVVNTTEDELVYDDDDDEHVSITTTEEQVVTTWTQACPTCEVEVCTSNSDDPVETCSFIVTFPPFPQCEDEQVNASHTS